MYRRNLLLRSVGHRLKTHRITPATGNERGDIEIKDYVILSHGEDDKKKMWAPTLFQKNKKYSLFCDPDSVTTRTFSI